MGLQQGQQRSMDSEPVRQGLPLGLKPKRTWDLKTPMKQPNWNEVPVQKLTKEAFWVKVDDSEFDLSGEISEALAQNFSSDPRSLTRGKNDKSKKGIDMPSGTFKRSRELKVLDQKDAQNLMISLSSSRVTADEITKYIITVDEEHLDAEILEHLRTHLVPQQQKIIKSLEEYRDRMDELNEAEQFALTLCSIKRLEPRLKSMIFKLEFEEQISDIKPAMKDAIAACEEVKRSQKLAKILKHILVIGNIMKSQRGGAFGFELSFLPKLVTIKASNTKKTLLHFLVDIIEKKAPDALNFHEELKHIDLASRIQPDELQNSIGKMRASIKTLNDYLQNFQPHNSDDRFGKVMTKFLKEAEKKFSHLEDIYTKMNELYQSLAAYYVFDPEKYKMSDFFSDLKVFKDQFIGAHKENAFLREQEEKLRRVNLDRKRREMEKQKRFQQDQNVCGDADGSGVIDNYIHQLNTGQAFLQRPRRTKISGVLASRAQAVTSR